MVGFTMCFQGTSPGLFAQGFNGQLPVVVQVQRTFRISE